MNNSEDFIIDGTNLRKKFRKQTIDFLHAYGAYIIGVNFNTDMETCIKRRKGQISEDIIRNMKSRMMPIDKTEVNELIEI